MTRYLVFDIGGTNLKYGWFDQTGKLLEKGQVPTVTTGIDPFIDSMKQIIDRYQGQYAGIAVCAPGKIDAHTKTIYYGGALPFLHRANLQKLLGDVYHVPISVENDGKAAALAEAWLGQLKGVAQGAMIVLGTGVGGGLIINGKLLHGAHFQAGELSFIDTDASRDEAESFTGMNASAVQMIMNVNKAMQHPDLKDGQAAFRAISAKEPKALTLFNAFCRQIAVMILNLQAVADMQRIVIGGGISQQPIVVSAIQEACQKLYHDNPGIAFTLTLPEIVKAEFSSDANLYGALYALKLQQDAAKK